MKVDLKKMNLLIPYSSCSNKLTRGLTVLLLTLFTSHGYASALYVPETANPTDTAFAGAGVAGRAQDAGTVFSNPAGMTRFNDPAMLASGGLTFVRAPFNPDSGNTISGTDGSATGFVPFGSFAYIYPVSDQLKLGISFQNNFGLSLGWGTNWVGRYTATQATITAPQVQPTIAYKVNDWLSVGAGAGLTLGYLDAKLRVEMREEIKDLQKKLGITTIYVTHDQEEAMTISDRIAVQNRGIVRQVGTPNDIYNHPIDLFIATFIGRGTLLEGKVYAVDDKARVKIGDDIFCGVDTSHNLTEGSDASCVMRPENFSLTKQGDQVNILEGIVKWSAFIGPYKEVKLAVGDNTILLDVPPEVETPVGAKLKVYISHKETIVLPKGEQNEENE